MFKTTVLHNIFILLYLKNMVPPRPIGNDQRAWNIAEKWGLNEENCEGG